MRAWKAVILIDLALVLGVGAGWLWWGRRAERLEEELVRARAAPASGQREWTVRGVVRVILPELNVMVLSHEEIAGFMTPMTMGFRAASPKIYKEVRVGDEVRFTVRGTPPDVVITAVEKVP
jgi:Cu/Ag efflux protein CusF